MCVAALAWQAHPEWRLVAIGNRDEYHARPAAPLHAWDDMAGVIAGRDLKSGGTWLGVSESGRFVLVTNRRGFGDPDPAKASRGAMVTQMLTAPGSSPAPEAFNPFNLIAADGRHAHFIANRPETLRTALAHGIYGLSNGALDEPWPKTLYLKGALLDWLNAGSDDLDSLFAPLASQTVPRLGIHPDQPSEVTDEPRDTAPFIRHPLYGTRCSTVVGVRADGTGVICERRFDADANLTGETALEFRWPV